MPRKMLLYLLHPVLVQNLLTSLRLASSRVRVLMCHPRHPPPEPELQSTRAPATPPETIEWATSKINPRRHSPRQSRPQPPWKSGKRRTCRGWPPRSMWNTSRDWGTQLRDSNSPSTNAKRLTKKRSLVDETVLNFSNINISFKSKCYSLLFSLCWFIHLKHFN